MIAMPSGLIRFDEVLMTSATQCSICDGHMHHHGEWDGNEVVTKGMRFCLKIECEHGVPLLLTPDHQVQVAAERRLVWKRADELYVGDHVVVAVGQNAVQTEYQLGAPKVSLPPGPRTNYVEHQLPKTMTPDLAWITGLLIADGSIPSDGRGSIQIATKKRSESLLMEKLAACFGVQPKILSFKHTQLARQIWIHSRQIREFFVQHVGVDPKDKLRVPVSIRRSPKSVVHAFLDGLMLGDGHWPVISPRWSSHPYLTTISPLFAQEVCALSMWAGRPAKVQRGNRRLKGGYSWRVMFCDESCWTDLHGKPCLTRTVPTGSRLIYRSRKSGRLFWRTGLASRSGVTRSLLRELEPQHELLQDGLIFAAVKSIKSVGDHPVYDMHVHPSHLFTASGVLCHNCAFCTLPTMRKMYPVKKFVRYPTAERAIAEIEAVADRWTFSTWVADDDVFTHQPDWIINEWAAKYPDRLRHLKWEMNLRVETASEEVIRAVVATGCALAKFGLESGDPELRKNVYDRNITNEQTAHVFALCRKHGLKAHTFNILGAPDETRQQVWQTVRMNQKLRPERVQISILVPYPGTPLGDQMEREGRILKHVDNYFSESPVKLAHLKPWEVKLYFRFFRLMVYATYSPRLAWQEIVGLWRRSVRDRAKRLLGLRVTKDRYDLEAETTRIGE